MNLDLKVEVVDGVAHVTDAGTGQALTWVHTVDIVMPPGAAPVLYLGTFDFSASVSAPGPAPAPAPAVAPAVATAVAKP